MKMNRLFGIIVASLLSFCCIIGYAQSTPVVNVDSVSHAGEMLKSPSTQLSTEKININSASLEQLTSLKGIGKQKGQQIIDYRTQHGAFKSIEDLSNIKGFSPKVLASLQKNNGDRLVVQ